MPLQTVESFGQTIDTLVEARPNRLAVYNYAHLPHIFRAQLMIEDDDIPYPETKLKLMELTISKLIDSGYVYIGMDHFARPDDELALAQQFGFTDYAQPAGGCCSLPDPYYATRVFDLFEHEGKDAVDPELQLELEQTHQLHPSAGAALLQHLRRQRAATGLAQVAGHCEFGG